MSNVSNQKGKLSLAYFTTVALLVSLELVLGFTPLGFVAIPPVSITTMHIPVIICSIILGPSAGAILGLTFGIISLISATTGASLSPIDLLFSPFASGHPIYSLIMCIVPRVLLGIIPAYIYKFLYSLIKNRFFTIAISSAVATICHTLLVLGCLSIFFKALVIKQVFLTIISLNGCIEILVAVLIVPAVSLPVRKYVLSRNTLGTSI